MKSAMLALALVISAPAAADMSAYEMSKVNRAQRAADIQQSQEIMQAIMQGQPLRTPASAFRAVDTSQVGIYGVRIGQDSTVAAAQLRKRLGGDPKVGFAFPGIDPRNPKARVWTLYRHMAPGVTVTLGLTPSGKGYVIRSIVAEFQQQDPGRFMKDALGSPTAESNGQAQWCANPQSVVANVHFSAGNDPCYGNKHSVLTYEKTLIIN